MNTRARVAPATELQRLRIEVRGLVQGVGFRPQALRVARDMGLAGWVRNHGAGVSIEVEGHAAADFPAALEARLPPLARVDALTVQRVPPRGERGFVIAPSHEGDITGAMPGDLAVCADCLRELFDPRDRRHRHPFIACCNCGPRFSMAQRLPYDRSTTAMAAFDLCDACESDYRDPSSRRLHAEPIACHDCGPRLSHSVDDIATTIRAGGIVALKGIGGFHLLCDARNETAVRRLRQRKRRPVKPLAVMALNAASAARETRLDEAGAALLGTPQRPIVILPRHAGSALPDTLSPGVPTLGVMLPYTPLHYLLFEALLDGRVAPTWLTDAQEPLLVFTSANRSGEPMVSDNADAVQKLAGVADLVVTHDREIHNACDDSVVCATGSRAVLLRRGRGHAPAALRLGRHAPEVLALGAQLKNTVCVLRGDSAVFSSHVGDLETPDTCALLRRSVDDLLEQLRVAPRAVACDLHRDFASTRLAEAFADDRDLPLIRVQHHHAHVGAALAAECVDAPAIGVALDGHGLGTDGSAWGGELLRVDGARCERLGHLAPLSLPGGDGAAREPWRIAAAWLDSRGRREDAGRLFRQEPMLEGVLRLAASPGCASTSAAGRCFDLAAALLGICTRAAYEAQAAMQLEGLCDGPVFDSGLYAIEDGCLSLDPVLQALVACRDARHGAALFHGALIDGLTAWVAGSCERSGLDRVALSGGCFANRWLASCLPDRLRRLGVEVLTGWDRVPPGDGGISLGQAWVAARWLESRETRED